MSNKKTSPNEAAESKKIASPARIIICLTVICIAVAALLGAVDHFTRPTIEENERNEKQSAIKSIFGDDVTTELISGEDADNEVYLIFRDGKVYGYCAETAPSGFGGEIKMMVGVDSAGAVCGVTVVSMSETPGLGSRTNSPAFLDQFVGKRGELAIGVDVDAVSGATISSDAVTRGVSEALLLGIDLEALAAERNTTVWNGEDDDTAVESETEAPIVEPEDTAEAEPETTNAPRLEDTISYVDQIEPTVDSPAEEAGAIDIDVHTDTEAFITETNEPPKDRWGNYIFPEEETETEEAANG